MERKFEVVTRYQNQNINLPQRQTKHAAGYDLEAAEDFIVPAMFKPNFLKYLMPRHKQAPNSDLLAQVANELTPVLVPTGLKVKLPSDEVLLLVSRSSGPLKRGLILPNSVGVIDADYYGNDNNEGEIFVQMANFWPADRLIRKGERICQGIFTKYLITTDDQQSSQQRKGGFGSSGQ
ncbi:dCTP deaminase/dUTPase family protein [Bombilactobacillus thymidiniphilus]|uniref:dUTP diphosphatase n=1 Tax=Bombilactobacillus thymidiniphilus TaxID=2923363 RepID=A0ABY4PFM1_9LACO|nr:dUTP diphosphatase [Bombilactobacillus thymidiniphilus]UQS84331.1 dUTP diphosphatase [Bombilactobacillus thymidiniphilus]